VVLAGGISTRQWSPLAASRSHTGERDEPRQCVGVARASSEGNRCAAGSVDTAASLRREIELVIHQIANEDRLGLSGREQALLAEELVQDMTGYGPLEPLLRDEQITDIMVNGPDNIYVERKGKQACHVRFRDASHITMVAQKIAAGVGRRVDEANPMVDARLSDGSRVNVVLPPLAIDSPCVSIRKFPSSPGPGRDGEKTQCQPAWRNSLASLPLPGLSILVSGGTGSGKTTLLNAMSQLISVDERIITIEDAAAALAAAACHTLGNPAAQPRGAGLVTERLAAERTADATGPHHRRRFAASRHSICCKL
jgi:pilus assembly protein CpaF